MITAVQISQLLQSAIVFGTVIMFGALGEILTQKSGNLNLGVPGIMYLGGIAGLAMSYFYEGHVEHPNGFVSLILSFIAAFAAAALGGLIYSFLTITLRANQNVTGLSDRFPSAQRVTRTECHLPTSSRSEISARSSLATASWLTLRLSSPWSCIIS